jgi:hypothetical protein
VSDDDMTPDQRPRGLAADALTGHKAGRVSLRQLVDSLDVVWSGLERSSWSDEFRGHWNRSIRRPWIVVSSTPCPQVT